MNKDKQNKNIFLNLSFDQNSEPIKANCGRAEIQLRFKWAKSVLDKGIYVQRQNHPTRHQNEH